MIIDGFFTSVNGGIAYFSGSISCLYSLFLEVQEPSERESESDHVEKVDEYPSFSRKENCSAEYMMLLTIASFSTFFC